MIIVFANPNPQHPYTVATADQGALAGSETIQVNLARAMARRGHTVRLLTGHPTPVTEDEVQCYPISTDAALYQDADAIVVLNYPPFALNLRTALGDRPRIIAQETNVWPGAGRHADALAALEHSRDTVLCLSDWHRNHFIAAGLGEKRVMALPPASDPLFESPAADLLADKASPVRLAYTPAPYKGLLPALEAFALLRQSHRTAELHVYSDFKHYPANNQHRQSPAWLAVYQRCQSTPGVHYHGTIPRPALAQALSQCLALLYPCVMWETAGLVVLEAQAAGCRVITSASGALPEITGGHADLLPPPAPGQIDPAAFAGAAAALLDQQRQDPDAVRANLAAARAWTQRFGDWENRAVRLERIIQAG